MPRWQEAPIVGGAYSDRTRPFSVQDTVNYLVVNTERPGTRTQQMLRGVPGLVTVADSGSGAPHCGARNVEGLYLFVSGKTLYKMDTKFNCTAIGTIPGVSRVSMAHNQVDGGNQVAIGNGQSGYVYDTRDNTLVQITDDGFPGATTFQYADSYILGIEPGRRFAYFSALADATSYSTLDRVQAESSPDALVGQIVSHREWWLLGQRTVEIFTDTGDNTTPWQRMSGTGMEVGAASQHAIVILDNSVLWLGSDGIVYRADGYRPLRISTFPIEQAIAQCNMAQAFAFTYEDRGHKIFYLTFPDGHTWGFDVSSGEWHRRQSYGLDRWRASTLTYWNGMWVVGDYTNGKLYRLDWDVANEDGKTLERRRVTGVLSDDQNDVIINAIALVIDTGQPSIPAQIILTGDAPNGTIDAPYSFVGYRASGGTLPYTYSVTVGSLPDGITLDPVTGNLSGTPNGPVGTASFRIGVSDSAGASTTLPDTIAIADPTIDQVFLADAPLLYWPLTEASGAIAHDLSGNGYNGQVQGATTWTGAGLKMTAKAAGVFLDCGTLSGSPLDVGSLPEWAVESVVTLDVLPDRAGVVILAQERSPNLGLYNVGMQFDVALPNPPAYVRGGFNDSVASFITDPTSLAVSTRAHFVTTKVGNVLYLYRNGVVVAQAASTILNNRSDGAGFRVGGTTMSGYFPNSYGWLGTVERVTVYQHGLSAERILAHAVALGLA